MNHIGGKLQSGHPYIWNWFGNLLEAVIGNGEVPHAKKSRDGHPIIGLIVEQADTLLRTVDDMVGMEEHSEP